MNRPRPCVALHHFAVARARALCRSRSASGSPGLDSRCDDSYDPPSARAAPHRNAPGLSAPSAAVAPTAAIPAGDLRLRAFQPARAVPCCRRTSWCSSSAVARLSTTTLTKTHGDHLIPHRRYTTSGGTNPEGIRSRSVGGNTVDIIYRICFDASARFSTAS